MNRQTYQARKQDPHHGWVLLDATNKPLGRLSSKLATILMGKHKVTYTPQTDVGDFVVVTNLDKMKLTGAKADAKEFQTYTGYTSGQKIKSYRWMLENRPEKLLERSLRGMLPKTKMGRHMLAKCKMYRGELHPHSAQNPQKLDW